MVKYQIKAKQYPTDLSKYEKCQKIGLLFASTGKVRTDSKKEKENIKGIHPLKQA